MSHSCSFGRKATSISAIVLSGGRGTRMGNQDKGLLLLNGKPLIKHVLDRISPQVSHVVISCNRNLDQYRQFGFPVVTDSQPGRPGPLAGILSSKSKITTPLCFIVPCDMPYVPDNIVSSLSSAMQDNDVVTASVDDKMEPLISLIKTDCIDSIETYLKSGNRSVRGWLALQGGKIVKLPGLTIAFRNINSPQELDLGRRT